MESVEDRAYCQACGHSFPVTDPCEHFKKYNYKPGDSIAFIQKLIEEKYEPGGWAARKRFKKTIGTSSGNTRTKDTKCTKCGKDLNHMSQERIQKHVQDHAIQEEKDRMQGRLF